MLDAIQIGLQDKMGVTLMTYLELVAEIVHAIKEALNERPSNS